MAKYHPLRLKGRDFCTANSECSSPLYSIHLLGDLLTERYVLPHRRTLHISRSQIPKGAKNCLKSSNLPLVEPFGKTSWIYSSIGMMETYKERSALYTNKSRAKSTCISYHQSQTSRIYRSYWNTTSQRSILSIAMPPFISCTVSLQNS